MTPRLEFFLLHLQRLLENGLASRQNLGSFTMTYFKRFSVFSQTLLY